MGGVKSSDGKQNGRGKREEARLRGSHQKTPTGRVDPVGGFDEFRSHSIHAPYQIPGTAWPVTNCAENRPCSRLANIVQAGCAVLRSVCGNRQDRKACFLVDERRCVEVENGVSEIMRTRNKAEAHINALYLVLEFLSQSTNDRMTEQDRNQIPKMQK